MDYKQKIEKVTSFIGKHLDDELTLDELSAIACFSKFHFHRLFSLLTGLSLQQYIRWLRLKRAAHQLIVDKDKAIIDIAINAGFESHEAFSRAFKQSCGVSPSEFRAQLSWHAWDVPPYCLPKQKGVMIMNVIIENKPLRRLAVVEHRGSPEMMGESVNKLIAWATAQSMDLKLTPGEAFGLGYDDPRKVAPEAFRHDLGITVPEQLKLSGGVVEKHLPAGRYAVIRHQGSRSNIDETVYALYHWVADAGENLGDLPVIFCHYNFDHEVAETELLTECWLLLQD